MVKIQLTDSWDVFAEKCIDSLADIAELNQQAAIATDGNLYWQVAD